MGVNLKVRFRNKTFWVFVISLLLQVTQYILEAKGITEDFTPVANSIWEVFKYIWASLTALGIVVDPTTEGLKDSALAMTYEVPKPASVSLTKQEAINKIVELAIKEKGYIGHKSVDKLDDPTANKGGLYTKYARDLDNVNYFYGKKQGEDWCCVFICWLFYKVLGKGKALQVLNQNGKNNYGAGCKYICEYLTKQPQTLGEDLIGSIICYDYEKTGSYDHVGIVVSYDSNYIYVIQGNAQSVEGSGVGEFIHSVTHENIKGIYSPYWERFN